MTGDDYFVEKLMSAARDEFVISITRLLGKEFETAAQQGGEIVFPVGDGSVEITFTELPKKKLGGLLELPQANVALRFRGVGELERDAFMQDFDLAFQRGGG